MIVPEKHLKSIGILASLLISICVQAENSRKHHLVEASIYCDTASVIYVHDPAVFSEGWSNLAQPVFWQHMMTLPEDSAILNIGSTRQILKTVAISDWDTLTDDQKTAWRDSIKEYYCLPEDEHIYLTSGKSGFYHFEQVLEPVTRASEIFQQQGVDPFYAQSILLIESPKGPERSPVGAHGSFQIMRKVAIKMGLKVNRYVDERKDFDKCAWASAKLLRTICIPETKAMLNELGVGYDENALWFRLLVLHVYHAGAYNVKQALMAMEPDLPCDGGQELIVKLWGMESGRFRNASQNYSQIVLASTVAYEQLVNSMCGERYACDIQLVEADNNTEATAALSPAAE